MERGIMTQQYLYAEDLIHGGQFQTAQVVIDEVIPPGRLKSADKRPIDKTTLRFKGKDKMLILCKTNEGILRYVTGQGPDGWAGHRITLQARVVDAFGAKTIAIRILPREGQQIRRALALRLGEKAMLDVPPPVDAQPSKPAPAADADADDWGREYDEANQND